MPLKIASQFGTTLHDTDDVEIAKREHKTKYGLDGINVHDDKIVVVPAGKSAGEAVAAVMDKPAGPAVVPAPNPVAEPETVEPPHPTRHKAKSDHHK